MEQQPITEAMVIHPHLFQKFMREGKMFSNLMALYLFYTYHAQQQKTNQPLATDEFTRNGLGWAMDRVKKTKRLLKKLKVIEVVQKNRYSYIRLFFIYTQKKLHEILGETKNSVEEKEEAKATTIEAKKEEIKVVAEPKAEPIKIVEEKKVEPKAPKSQFVKDLEVKIEPKKVQLIRNTILAIQAKEAYRFDPISLAKWIIYCETNSIYYTKSNLDHWLNKLNNKSMNTQANAIDKAISRKWKDFYFESTKMPPIASSVKEKLMKTFTRFG